MNDKISEKVINIFTKKNELTDKNLNQEKHRIKRFSDVSYVRLDEDVNGYPFDAEKLLKNAKKYFYIVRVLRKKENKYCLYNYNVEFEKLVDFITKFSKNELGGTIIEIEKYNPHELG